VAPEAPGLADEVSPVPDPGPTVAVQAATCARPNAIARTTASADGAGGAELARSATRRFVIGTSGEERAKAKENPREGGAVDRSANLDFTSEFKE
jgi:hypothetical protein